MFAGWNVIIEREQSWRNSANIYGRNTPRRSVVLPRFHKFSTRGLQVHRIRQLPVKWPLRRCCISRDNKNRISFLGVFAVPSNFLVPLLFSSTTRKFSLLIFFYVSFSLSFTTKIRDYFNSIISAQLFLFSFRTVIAGHNDRGQKRRNKMKEYRSITFN